jgi:hypothetical protein
MSLISVSEVTKKIDVFFKNRSENWF